MDTVSCNKIRENLDELFSGAASLEAIERQTKTNLLAHLECCDDCCRTFDEKVRSRLNRPSRLF